MGGNLGFLRSKATFSDSSLSYLHENKRRNRQSGVTTMEIRERHEKSGDETEQNDNDRFYRDVKKGNTLWNIAKGSDIRLCDLCTSYNSHQESTLSIGDNRTLNKVAP